MSLPIIVNSVNATGSGVLGTGLRHERKDIKRATTLVLFEKGLIFDNARDLQKEYILELQQLGKAIVLNGVVEMTDQTAENTLVTRTGSLEKILAGKAPLEFTAKFDNGLNYFKALNALESHRKYDLGWFDSKGDFFFTTTKAGEYKGFTLGMFANGKYMISNGADANEQSVSFQLVNRLEFDERVSWVESKDLDYNAQEDLDGVNDVVFELDAVSDGVTTAGFTCKLVDKEQVGLQGLAKTDLLFQINGVTKTLGTLVASTTEKGRYAITWTGATASLDGLTLKTFDSTLAVDVINLDGVLYKSNVAAKLVP